MINTSKSRVPIVRGIVQFCNNKPCLINEPCDREIVISVLFYCFLNTPTFFAIKGTGEKKKKKKLGVFTFSPCVTVLHVYPVALELKYLLFVNSFVFL